MPGAQSIGIDLVDEAATIQLGEDLALAARRGDVFCLRGDLGAGKSTLARAMIRKLAGSPDLEVPSPTYTICQEYDLPTPVRHFDFFRLNEVSELDEAGLEDGLDSTISLIEWPEIAFGRLGREFVDIELVMEVEGRRAALHFDNAPAALDRCARSLEIRTFLDKIWHPGSLRTFLQGDASTRRYEEVSYANTLNLLMDARRQPDGPPIYDGRSYSRVARLAEDVMPFVAIDQLLRREGFAAPEIFAGDLDAGLLLIEHLGEERIVDADNRPVAQRYREAARLLARFHGRSWPRETVFEGPCGGTYTYRVPDYDRAAMMVEASLFADWYAPRHLGRDLTVAERDAFNSIWDDRLTSAGSPRKLVLRDFHSPNLIWREEEPFPANLGLIDFQDAVVGPIAYDVASLAQDARVDISAAMEHDLLNVYLEQASQDKEFDAEVFAHDYPIMAAQRATKILGIFVRLDKRDGKPSYLAHLPRLQDYLKRNLRGAGMEDLRDWYSKVAGLIPQ